jgi:hypothetical protein
MSFLSYVDCKRLRAIIGHPFPLQLMLILGQFIVL